MSLSLSSVAGPPVSTVSSHPGSIETTWFTGQDTINTHTHTMQLHQRQTLFSSITPKYFEIYLKVNHFLCLSHFYIFCLFHFVTCTAGVTCRAANCVKATFCSWNDLAKIQIHPNMVMIMFVWNKSRHDEFRSLTVKIRLNVKSDCPRSCSSFDYFLICLVVKIM